MLRLEFRLQDTFLIIPEAIPSCSALPSNATSANTSPSVSPFRVQQLRSRLKRRSSCGDTKRFCDLKWSLRHPCQKQRYDAMLPRRGPCMSSAPEIVSRCDGTQRQLRELRPFMKMSDHLLLLLLRRIEWGSPHLTCACAVLHLQQSQSGFNPKSRSSYN